MFNIKQLVNKITDKGNGPRVGESSSSVMDSEEQHSAEGFLCPPCMKAFPSPEALEEHYLKAHPMDHGDASRSDESLELLRQEIEILQTSLVEEKSMAEELKKEVIKKQSEISKQEIERSASANAFETLEENNSLLKSEVNLLRKQLTDELEHVSQLRKEKELLKDKLLTLASQNDTLAADNKTLQSQLNHRNTIDDAAVLRQELVSVQRLMDQMTQEKEKEVDLLNVRVKEFENTLSAERQVQQKSKIDLERAAVEHDQLMQYTDENYQLKRDLADSMAVQIKKDQEIDSLKEATEAAQKKITSLESQNQQLVQEKDARPPIEVVEISQSNEEQLRAEKASLVAEVESLKSQIADLDKSVQNFKQKLEKTEADGKKLVETHTAERKFVENKFAEYENKLKDKDEELSKNVSQLKTITNQKDAEIAKITAEADSLRGQIKEKVQQLKTLEATKASLESKIGTLEKNITELQSERDNIKKELLGLKDSLAAKIKEANEKQESVKELNKQLHDSLSELQVKTVTIASLEDALKVSKLSLEEKDVLLNSAITDSSARIEQIQGEFESQRKVLEDAIAESKARLKSLEDSLEEKVQEIAKLQAALQETEEFAAQTTGKVKLVEGKYQELEALSNELKYKFKSSEEEKALLAERCLTEQSKAESSHQAYEECKRKLEDSVAALQELGRENQSLQMESAKLQGRKWADDSVVNTCTGCVKEFTLTIRKHHCRHCGQIFCNDCSSRTASVPSSKKPVRVCDVCYQELTAK